MLEFLKHASERLRASAYAFPLAVLAAGLMLAISELGYHRAANRLGELIEMGDTRLQLVELVRGVADAESAQRGYMLTGRDEYLKPYRDASTQAHAGLARLQVLYQQTQNAAPEPELADFSAHVNTKLSETEEVLSLHAAGRTETARELMMTDIGRDEMVSIRQVSERMLARQNALVTARRAEVFGTIGLNRIGVAAMTAVSLLLLSMYLRQRREYDLERSRQQRLVQAERDRLEVQVGHRTAELTELARHLETAREDERARLARDLHDELGALLTAAKLDVARMRPKLQQEAPELMPRMSHLIETLNSGIALKRRIIEDLRPSSLSNLGLLPALEILCSEFGDRLAVPVQARLQPVTMSPACDLTAFRLVQESLNNIAKHAEARNVSVEVFERDGLAWVSVVDDGVGFDAAAMQLARHGLVGMRYRVQAEGGHLQVQSRPGQGTEVQASLPLAAAASHVPTASTGSSAPRAAV